MSNDMNPESSLSLSWSLNVIWLETIEHLKIAAPVFVTYVLRKSPDIVSIMFVGHIASSLQDVSSLDGTKTISHYVACVGLASVTANVTGNSMIIGMAGALSTICSQSYGAKDMYTFTTTLQKAILIELVCICAPVSLLWLFSEDLLLVLGQQPLISRDTSRYLIYLIPHLWASAVTYCIHNWLYAQSVTQPSAVIAVLTAAAHPLWCYVCIYVFGMGFLGAALAIVVTKFVELGFLLIYLNFLSNVLAETGFQLQWPWPWSREIPAGGVGGSIYNVRESWWPFLRLGLPNLMMMTEWWASEIIVFMSGVLSRDTAVSDVQVSAMTIYQNIIVLCWMAPAGLAVSGSTRVGNALGERDPGRSNLAAVVATALAALVSLLAAAAMVLSRSWWLFLFTSDPQTTAAVAVILNFLFLYAFADGIQTAITGVLQGMGRQRVGGPIVVVAYYVVGIPLSAALAFRWGLDLGVVGLCAGTTVGTFVHMILFVYVLATTEWRAAESIGQSEAEEDSGGLGLAGATKGDESIAVSPWNPVVSWLVGQKKGASVAQYELVPSGNSVSSIGGRNPLQEEEEGEEKSNSS